MKVTKAEFFEDLSVEMDWWVNTMSGSLVNPLADLTWVSNEDVFRAIQRALAGTDVKPDYVETALRECLHGFANSILTAIDGGTALAEKGRVYLLDEDGNCLGEGLHEDFGLHLMETGRL